MNLFQPSSKNEDVKNSFSCMLKNEDKTLPHLLKTKTSLLKMLKTDDLKIPVKDAEKMKTVSCAGSPIYFYLKTLCFSQMFFTNLSFFSAVGKELQHTCTYLGDYKIYWKKM